MEPLKLGHKYRIVLHRMAPYSETAHGRGATHDTTQERGGEEPGAPGDTQEAPRGTQRHPGGTQDDQSPKTVKINILSILVARNLTNGQKSCAYT